MLIEVTPNVEEGSYFSKKENKQVAFRDQEAYVALQGERYPKRFRIRLRPNQAPFPEGKYSLSGRSFGVGTFGDLQLRELVLEPVK